MVDNFTLRDEIKAYWSKRAENFDAQPGHGISAGAEKQAWLAMLAAQLGPAEGRRALDLACGTGEISHLLHDFGLNVTGLEWSEAMLEIARNKADQRASGIRFLTGDAEQTLEPDSSYDIIVTRHLVWTLVDPDVAFSHWFRLLKSGGVLLIIDGDFVNHSVGQRLLKWLIRKIGAGQNHQGNQEMQDTHQKILDRVYFSGGAKAGQVKTMLHTVGFGRVDVQTDLSEIQKAQAAKMGFLKGIQRVTQHRYIIRATK